MGNEFGGRDGKTVRVADAGAQGGGDNGAAPTEPNSSIAVVSLEAAARDASTRVALNRDGQLTLLLDNGREVVIEGADPLLSAFRAKPWLLLQYLNDDRDVLVDVIKQATNPDSTDKTFTQIVDKLGGLEKQDNQDDGPGDARAFSGDQSSAVEGSVGPANGRGQSDLGGLNEETGRFGRDDLKRGEMGAAGENPTVGTGKALGHLTGLPDEEPGLRNGEKIVSTDNTRFEGETFGVGSGIDHLWLLGDFEYYRSSGDHRNVDEILPDHGSGQPVYDDLIKGKLAYELVEDNVFCGELFSAAKAVLPASDIKATIDPAVGTIVINPDGTFKFTPVNGFSGKTSFDYEFTDPRTGIRVTGTADITVFADADPAQISGAATTPEDTLIATPVTVTLGDLDGSETICDVEITNVPVGATIDFSGPIAATRDPLPGGGIRLTGNTADIQAALQLLTFDPPLHFSGQVTLNVTVKTIESHSDPSVPGYLDTETVVHPLVIDVIPVADLPPVTGGNYVTDEDVRVPLAGIGGNLVDTDGSEVLSFEIAGVDPGAKLENAAGVEFPFVVETDGTKTYTINPTDIGGVFYNPNPNDHGTDNMTITAIATEQANGDEARNPAPIQVVINPVEDLPTISGASATDEDTAVNFGNNIIIGPVIDADGSESITQVQITGVPAGVTPTFTPVPGATVVFTPGTGTITVTGTSETAIRDAVKTLTLTPPDDSDVNIDLQVTVTTTDAGVVASTPPITHTIAVAAVADAPNLGGAAAGNEDQPIALPITTSLNDTDGSEEYDFAEVTVPAGVTLIVTALPPGITQTAIPGGLRFEPGPSVSSTDFEAFLANNLQVQAPQDSDVDFNARVRVGVEETTLSGGELTTQFATREADIPVTVNPVPDLPTITGASAMNEDAITNTANPASVVPLNFGADIGITENDKTDGSEAITQIVVSGIPEGATVTYTPVLGGAPVTVVGPTGGTSITLAGGTEDQIRAALDSMTIVPPAHEDDEITLGLAITKNDNGVIATQNGSHTITISAVADAPTISGTASGLEDQPIGLQITADLVDTDGSETYEFAEVTVPAGVAITVTSLPAGVTQTAITGGFRFDFDPGVISTANVEAFLLNNIRVQAPLDSDVNFDADIKVGTIESTPVGGQVALLRNESTTTVNVEVTPVVDTPTINSSSTVKEDGIDNVANPAGPANTDVGEFGTAIEAGITLGETAVGDISEEITQVVITGVPLDATIGTGTVAGATIDTGTPGQITVTGTSETAIRDALKTLTIVPGTHKDDDIPLGVAVTVRDNDPDDAGDTTSQVFNGTHTVNVAAVADAPVISGTASGLEDQPIGLQVTADLVDTDGSETYEFAEVTVPAGVAITVTTLPAGVTQTAITGGFRFDFDPGVISTANVEAFLLNNIRVQAPLDSDVNFDADVKVGTIESTLAGGQVALLRNESTTTVNVEVTPVVDTPAINSSSTVKEDGIDNVANPAGPANTDVGEFGTAIEAGITLGETAVGDTSEEITQVVITGVPLDATIGTGTVAGATIDTGTPGQITVTGTNETAIRDALKTLTIVPGTHKDDDIPLGVAVTVRDNDPDDAGDTTSQVFNGTHTVNVAAVADAPVISGTASGLEDQPIGLQVTADLVDTDGSETYEFAEVTVPAGVAITVTTLPAGVTQTAITGGFRFDFDPGVISTANVEAFLLNNIRVQAPLDSDVNFDADVKVGTIESTPVGGQVALLRNESTTTVNVEVTPVVDTPAINSSSTVKEDGIDNVNLPAGPANTDVGEFGTAIEAGITLGETAVGDISEEITQVVITGVPLDATIGTGTVAGATIDTGTPGQITVTGTNETAIRDALKTLTIVPGTHKDDDIPLGVAVTVRDNDPDDAGDTTSQVFNGTHTVQVAAVADEPTLTSTAVGFEDQSIPVTMTAGLIDTDGSETIKNVVIENVPAEFTLTESSALGGLLTNNGGGRYTVTGASDAEINDILNNLSLAIAAPTHPRTHVDTNFNLSVTVTTQESNPTEAGAGQVAHLEESETFTVPVTVHAVADPVTHSGSSVLVEDINANIGGDIVFNKIDTDGTESVTEVTVTGFPAGSTVTFEPVGGGARQVFGGGTLTLNGGTEAQIRAALASLEVQAPLHSDVDFNLTVTATTTEANQTSPNVADHTETTIWTHAVKVQAVADAPSVVTNNITGNEDTLIPLTINADRSADGNTDNSEVLSVRITLPQDGGNPIGTIVATGTVVNGVTITDEGGGVYLIEGPGTGTPAAEEALLDAFLAGGLALNPRAQFSGTFTGAGGIQVDAISTETATGVGDQVAPNGFGGADNTSQTETVTRMIDVTINPIVDDVTFANSQTIVQENNNSIDPSDPDLVVPLGTRLGTTLVDLDGSQSLDMTLSNIPATAGVAFGGTNLAPGGNAVISGVTVSLDATGTQISVSGPNAATAITVLETLNLTLLDDDDSNFQVGISGTTEDTVGGPTSAFNATHDVIVQAVADRPNVNRGAFTKATVDEDSALVTYPVTIGLNDTDGSETYQSVRITVSTPGSGTAPTDNAIPIVDFGVTNGVTVSDNGAGVITLTGGTTPEMEAMLAALQVRPGPGNGEDITVSVRVTAVESNPSEDNNGAGAGLGGGVAGPEISIPTASRTQSFRIPVDPVPEVPTLTAPANANGTEDTSFALNGVSISKATADPDGSESNFFEIDTSSFPFGTEFTVGGVVQNTIVGGFLRIAEADLPNLHMQAPLHYSGIINLSVRAAIVDDTTSNDVTATTAVQTIAVDVDPIADPMATPIRSVGVEDNGPVAFGADIANTTTGLRVIDNVVGGVGPGGDETLSRLAMTVPADTATQTYTMSGTHVPGADGTIAGSGTAEVTLSTDGGGNRTYTITSTIITGVADPATLTDAQRDQAEADIRATLATFQVEMGPTHTDLEGAISVTGTALDVKDGDASTRDTTYSHEIRIQAVADTPTIVASAIDASVAEDGASARLAINPGRSPDDDNSEVLSVRITVPSDILGPVGTITGTPTGTVTVTDQGSGVYLVEATGADPATREAALDGFLNGGGLSFDPRTNFSGDVDLTIESISTEQAIGVGIQVAPNAFGGADNTSQTETVATTVTVAVTPTVDTPTVKGNAIGNEDSTIPVPLNITLADKDGSETFTVRISAVVPPTTRIFGAGGAEIFPDGGGFYNLSAADVGALSILPPEHFSTANHPDIQLTVQTTVTDTGSGAPVSQTFTDVIPVIVQGVADKPNNPAVSVSADEDQPIGLGAAALAAAGGSLDNLTPDNDGSETVSIILEGLPASVVPSSTTGDVTFIGGGMWSISADALPNLVLPPVPNFSGTNPYPGLTLRATSQEEDGDQAESDPWPITIEVNPIIDTSTVDGFSSWSAAVTVTEDNDIPLSNVTNHTLVDSDGSEAVVSYTFDLSNLIANAGIGQRLIDLHGPGAGLDEFVANHINGTIDNYDSGTGEVRVLVANIGAFGFDASAFLDSNVDFNIPVSALVRDTATLTGGDVVVDKTETTTFNVDLVGDADIPTAFANNAAGLAFDLIPLVAGGENTDTDSDLGRAESEDQLYYILEVQNVGATPNFFFMDSANNIVGANLGGDKYLIQPHELADLNVKTDPGPGGTIEFTWTTYTVENDGDIAENQAPGTFTVTVLPNGGTVTPPSPLPPIITVNPVGDDEDGSVVLNAVVNPDPADTTNPTVTVVIGNLPPGTTITGAFLDPAANEWVASADDVNAGNVVITPPPNFSGDLPFTVRAIATNEFLRTAQTADEPHSVPIDPVADGVSITASPDAGSEDVAFDLNISLAAIDGTDQSPGTAADTPEVVDNIVYVRASSGTLSAGTLVVGGPFDGFNQMTQAELASLQLTSAQNLHGPVTIDVRASSTETDDDADGDQTLVSSASFTVDIAAVPDAPTNTVGGPYSGDEDTEISLVGLNADLVDTDGSEILSVKITGVPDGTLFSAGTNNGDGSWTIPKSALDAGTLTIKPPLQFSGTMSLVLQSFALETSNGNTDTSTTPFTVTVAPKADDVEILAKNVAADGSGEADLDLNVRMIDERGTTPGEDGPEVIQITFSDVPTGVALLAGSGGTVVDLGGNQWRFTGSEDQANDLKMAPTATSTPGTYQVGLSAVTIDGADTLATAVTDSFQLTVPAIVAGDGSNNTLNGAGGTQLLFGEGGNDTLNAGAGDDYLNGGTGLDVLTGAGGADTFGWSAGDLDGSIDQVVDFTAADGDVLDVSQLLVGFDPGTSVLSDFLQISGAGTVTLSVDINGAVGGANFQDFATFANAGQSLDDLRTNGNLIV